MTMMVMVMIIIMSLMIMIIMMIIMVIMAIKVEYYKIPYISFLTLQTHTSSSFVIQYQYHHHLSAVYISLHIFELILLLIQS